MVWEPLYGFRRDKIVINKINESVNYIKSKIDFTPEIGLVLGSGLGNYGETLENKVYIDYKDIPNFHVSTVEGHKGRFVLGEISGKKVICMQGRHHYYEGNGMDAVTYPIRVMAKLGIKTLFTTNATGGVNENFTVGDFMVITDHINFMGTNPLIGENLDEFGPRFPDMSNIYDKDLVNLALSVSDNIGIKLQTGVFLGYMGPSYETPAEIRMFKLLGADNVGMSTVPETIVANHAGLKVLSISSITNMAAGISKKALSHDEVQEVSTKMVETFKKLVDEIIKNL